MLIRGLVLGALAAALGGCYYGPAPAYYGYDGGYYSAPPYYGGYYYGPSVSFGYYGGGWHDHDWDDRGWHR
ncbi:MAG: hypothetical protein KGL11_15275 [Alphaproteobacteria bacterium]|nr:hypothetical protein [Alphaproteobacteria bacterium]